jgi:uncharacterized membrane protein YeaQ/YmgE (transglycosylase-associated protein family)
VALTTLVATGGGCRTTVQAGHVLTPASERIIRDEQPRAPLEVVVPIGGGRQEEGTIVRVLPNEAIVLVGREGDGARELSVPAAGIHRVDVADHASGALKGAGIGLLAGGAVGALAGGVANKARNGSDATLPAIGAIVLGLAGALIGVFVGGARGDVTSYRFD